MKVIVAMNSFKGSLSAVGAGLAVKDGFLKGYPESFVENFPMADGGDGTLEILQNVFGGDVQRLKVAGPYGDEITAPLLLTDIRGVRTAVIESAKASGLALLGSSPKDVFKAHSSGVGQLMLHAVKLGAKRIVVGIGGTAFNDGGIGAVIAAGGKVLGREAQEVPLGIVGLLEAHSVGLGAIPKLFQGIEIIGITDVENPLVGRNGATYVYGPQKGLAEKDISKVDKAMKNYAHLMAKEFGEEFGDAPMCGAGGGLGAALKGFFSAKLVRGSEYIMEAIGFNSALKGASLVITGEGRVDRQTLEGKAPHTVALRCEKEGIPCVVLGGGISQEVLENRPSGFAAVLSCQTGPASLREAMEEAANNLAYTASQIGALCRMSRLGAYKKVEFAAGGVILRLQNGVPEVLLIKDRYDKYALPKGHVEEGETFPETAIREVFEETGIEAKILGNVGDFSHLFFGPNMEPVKKTVRYYAMVQTGGTPCPQPGETGEVLWEPIALLGLLPVYGNAVRIIQETVKRFPLQPPGT